MNATSKAKVPCEGRLRAYPESFAAWCILPFFAGTFLLAGLATRAQQQGPDLSSKTIQDLMNIEVTSASKKEEKLSRTASAVFVVTQADIQKSGATNIPDLLRMVPGLDVAQINENTWAISARGFNGRFANELLVLVDGRSVYTQVTGGVFWDTLDLPFNDIDRIEVVRGPGASLWGANAVNGVINIITKEASATQGSFVESGGGNVEEGFATAQYGGRLPRSSYRAFAEYFNRDHFDPVGGQSDDGWHMLRGGFRTDTAVSPADKLTLEGGLYAGREGQQIGFLPALTAPGPELVDSEVNISGGFVRGAWEHHYSDQSDISFQSYFDRYERDDALNEGRATFDATFQHHFAWGSRQDFIWGLGYRYSASNSTGSLFVSLHPADLGEQLFSGFAQDEIALSPNRVYLTGGAKVEHNYFTGFNVLPRASIVWLVAPNETVWTSVARAVRTPADTDADIRLNVGGFIGEGGTATVISIFGNRHLVDEGTNSYEAGYRALLRKDLSFDLAAYYATYDHQETTEPETPFMESSPAPPHLVLPSTYENLMHGESPGVEAFAEWNVTSRWNVSPGYAFQKIHMRTDPTSKDTTSAAEAEYSSPAHSASLRSRYTLPGGFDYNMAAYFVERIADPLVPSYTRLDANVTWHWKEQCSFTVAGQNLLQAHHLEYVDTLGTTNSTLVRRGVYAKFAWQF
ncbi:MAG TPA: TonB-dependent receptor [Candidatus Aquilonibacter sp.]|nr:TonB-dependent receptor [Candidatus Aquilonibacter sp.]